MSGVAPDLIAGYLEELCAGLRVPAAEAELIAAEAEDHLRETAAAGMAVGMTELEAQQAAISSFGPVRAVLRAHRRRAVTAAAAAMAAWKLAALLATTVGVGGLAGMGILVYLLRPSPGGMSVALGPTALAALVAYAAMAAGGLALLAVRRRARRGAAGRDPLSPGVTASCFLLASALLGIFGFLLRSAPAAPLEPPGLSCSFVCNFSGPAVGPDPVLTALVAYAAMAASGLLLLAVRRRARRGSAGRVNRMTERERLALRRNQVAFIFQAFGLVPMLSAAENVGIPLRIEGLRPSERRERVAAVLALTGMSSHAAHRPGELSGGQQQRVAIARALAGRPGVLIADEPTSQLDLETGRKIMELLLSVVRSEGITALVATHDEALIDLADQVISLEDGSIAGIERG